MGSIEEDGITSLRNFLSIGKLLQSKIKEDDKYQSWDGEIIVYKISDHRQKKNNILGRVPVQVKSSKSEWKEKESISLKRSDLENYLNDGGVVVIRPMYRTTTDYKIFARRLFPVDLNRILKERNGATISIELEKFEDISHFETFLKFFIENIDSQSGFMSINADHIDYQPGSEFLIKYLKQKNVIKSILSNNCYTYYKSSEGFLIPTSLKFETLKGEKEIDIKIGDTIFFEKVFLSYTKDGLKKIEINSCIHLTLENDEINIHSKIDEKVLFDDILISLEFHKKAIIEKHFYIGEKRFNVKDENEVFIDRGNEDFTRKLKSLFDLLNIETRSITIGAINENHRVINFIVSILIEKKEYELPPKELNNEFILQTYGLFNNKIIIIFTKIKDHKYIGEYFFENESNNKYSVLVNEGNRILCSKFIIIPMVLKERTVENIEAIVRHKEIVLKDIKKYYTYESFDFHIRFILHCLNYYDKTKNEEMLDIGNEVIKLFKKFELSHREKDVLEFNRLQVVYRRRPLKRNENKTLLQIRERNNDSLDFVCCIMVLLESYSEFEILFNELEKDKKEEFKTWPIWNLYQNKKSLLKM